MAISPQENEIELNTYPVGMDATLVSSLGSNTSAPPTNETNIKPTGNGSVMAGGNLQSPNYVDGVSGWLLDSDGRIKGVMIITNGGRIANWYINTNTIASGSTEAGSNVLIDSANSLIRLGPTSGNYIILDGANLRIRSSNYSAGVAGFNIEPGLVEAENILARGSLRGATFKYDVISAVGGQLMVANADVIATDMTALDASTMTIKGDVVFQNNDILLIRAVTASGIEEEYLRVTNSELVDSYSEANSGGHFSLYSTQITRVAQSFTVTNASTLGSAKFYIFKAGSPTGNAVVKLYAHSGVYGTSSEPTGAALATSDNLDVSTLTGSYQLKTFTFSGANQYALQAATKYVISIEFTGGDGSNYVGVGTDSTSPTHSGNTVTYNGAYTIWAGVDTPFYVLRSATVNTYTVTRDLAGAYSADNNPVWKAGTPVTVIGSSDGATAYSGGYLRLLGAGANAPHYSVFKRTGVAYNAVTEYCRLGNLNGFLDYVSEEYGLAIGESTKYLKYDPTNGLRIAGQIQSTVYLTAGEALTDGNAVMIGAGTVIAANSYTTQNSSEAITDPADWKSMSFSTTSKAISISSVTLYLAYNSATPVTVTVAIYATSGGLPTGAALGSVDVAISSAPSPVPTERTFTFATPITVSASTTYQIVAHAPIGGGGDHVSWYYQNSGSGAGKSGDGGSNWSTDANKQRYYKINEIQTVAGNVYKASAAVNNEYVTGFIGFVIGSFSAGQTATILIVGQTTNLSGLTTGSAYYLSDTLGAISTSAGSVSKKIGISLSATSLLILNS
jgi:hypothetical protein